MPDARLGNLMDPDAPSPREAALREEVRALAQTIAAAKAEIQALGVDEITGNQIPSATDELDAIVEHTAKATDAILEACETVDGAAGALEGEWSEKLMAATTQIYEACSFQDITGQRIRKVVGTLKAIDAKVATMLARFGIPEPAAGQAPVLVLPPQHAHLGHGALDEAALLNGPQLPQNAMDQSDIDKLLASFG